MKKEVKKTSEKKMNIFTLLNVIIGSIMIVLMLCPIFGDIVIMCAIYAGICACGIVMGIIGSKKIKADKEKNYKTCNTVFLIINIVFAILMLSSCATYSALKDIEFADQVACPKVTNCEKNKDDKTSTCDFSGVEVQCSNSVLNKKQYK